MSSMIEAFIMITLAFFYAPRVKTGIIKSQHGSKLYVYKLTDKAAGQSKALKWWVWSIGRSMASFPIWRLLLWCWEPLEWTLPQPASCECKDTFAIMAPTNSLIQAYKHVFTSPSSVEKEAKATHSGNAHLHGMTSVTPGSIAYITTQVYLKLISSCTIFHIPSSGLLCIVFLASVL